MAPTTNAKTPAVVSKGGRKILSMSKLIKKRKATIARRRPTKCGVSTLRIPPEEQKQEQKLQSALHTNMATKDASRKTSPKNTESYDGEFEGKSK